MRSEMSSKKNWNLQLPLEKIKSTFGTTMTWMTENLHRHSASKERKEALPGSQAKDIRFYHTVQQCRDLSFGTRPPEFWSSRKASVTQKFLPAHCKAKKEVIGLVFSLLIFGLTLFFLGTLMPLNHQQDAIKCPPDWIGHQGHCYKLSVEEKNWNESQNFCISHNASLAKIMEEEMAIVRVFTRDHVFWIGLKREPDQPWKWLDGENSTLEVMGNEGDCAYLDDDATASSGRCSTEHRYICKKQ